MSHRTAGVLWGMKGIESNSIEVCTQLERRVSLAEVHHHRSLLLFDDDVTRQRGVPVTSQARTIVDLSGSCSLTELGRALDSALRHGLRLCDLRRCVGRLPAGPGRRTSLVHALLADRLPGYDAGDSDLETRVLRLLVGARLPPPRQQYRVRLRAATYRIDLAYPDQRVAIELDGWNPHGTDRTIFDRDRARGNDLVLAGWTLLRFTSRSADALMVDTVRAARGLASAA